MTAPGPLGGRLVALAPIAAAGHRAVVVTDFDGTLAAIVGDPAAARPVPGARAALARAVGEFGTVAVVSGRPLAFLAGHFGDVGGLVLVGLYGLERRIGDRLVQAEAAIPWRPVVAGAADRLASGAPAGIEIERKGLTVTVHWRRLPAGAAWAAQAVEDEAARTGLVAHPGRATLELRPPLAVDKGTVVEELASWAQAACFFGDDMGDLPAFAALDRLAGERGVAVAKVVAADDECPPEVVVQADVVVEGPAGAVRALEELSAAAAGPGAT